VEGTAKRRDNFPNGRALSCKPLCGKPRGTVTVPVIRHYLRLRLLSPRKAGLGWAAGLAEGRCGQGERVQLCLGPLHRICHRSFVEDEALSERSGRHGQEQRPEISTADRSYSSTVPVSVSVSHWVIHRRADLTDAEASASVGFPRRILR
jgi:hypothetical protein